MISRSGLFDLASPRAGFRAAFFDKVFETFKIAFDSMGDQAQHVASSLYCTFGLIVHLQHYASSGVIYAVESYHSSIYGPTGTLPGDTFVRDLFSYLGIKLLVGSANIHSPLKMCSIGLEYLFNPLHETRKFFKLRPLVIGSIHGNINFDRLFCGRHGTLSSSWYRLTVLAAAND